jgi:glycosyltransferase involved in cell wall biosynthesis
MEIYFDNIVFDLQKAGGISVYFYEIIKRVLDAGYDLKFIEQGASSDNIFRKKLPIPDDRIIREKYIPVKLRRYLPIQVPIGSNSIIHSSYYRISAQEDIVKIVSVYDFSYEHFRQGLARFVHRLQKESAINNADGIICISENTKNDLLQFHGKIAADKIRVIHLAASNAFHRFKDQEESELLNAVSDHIIKHKYILFVGFRKHYKNFSIAVEVLKKLNSYKLVIVGGGLLSKDELIMLDNELPGRYIYLGNIGINELNILYNCAFCLLYPSSYEGFGIPILEAMQAGCPAVTTDRSSIPEVCGTAGLMVNRIDSSEFTKKIIELENISFRRKIVEAGLKQSHKFSWDKVFNETIEFYKEVYERKTGRRFQQKIQPS